MGNNDGPGAHVAEQADKILAKLNASSLDAFCSIRPSLPCQADDVAAESIAAAPLGGLPIAVKEIIDVADEVCARGCDFFANRVPGTTATIVQKLETLGAQVVGITRSTELAIARVTTTRNPHADDRSPGASSSGSAAAVGGGLVPFALGSQTIGSTIRPAAYCGIVGFKPTHGIVPLDGVMPLSPTLDHLGFLANSMTQLTSVTRLLDDRLKPDTETNFRFLFANYWFSDPVENFVKEGISRFRHNIEEAGFECIDWAVDNKSAAQEQQLTDTILVNEMAEHWFDSLHSQTSISSTLREFLNCGKAVSATQYSDALSHRKELIQTLHASLESRDIIVAPSVTGLPPLIKNGTGSRDPQRLWTLAGMPSLSLPIGRHEGLPLAVQLIAASNMDGMLLKAAQYVCSDQNRVDD